MIKLIQHNILEERHYLTKLLRLDMYEMSRVRRICMVEYYKGRLLGMVAAYLTLGFIDRTAHFRYIDIIFAAADKRMEEIENEV